MVRGNGNICIGYHKFGMARYLSLTGFNGVSSEC